MAGHIIHLIGFPGIGKLTVAKAIAKSKSDVVLVDNHLINGPIFSVIGYDGKSPLPGSVWEQVAKIRDVVLDAINHLSPQNTTFVFTNVMIEDGEDVWECRKIEKVANGRGGRYYPVIMTCDIEENRRRIICQERALKFKALDPSLPDRMHEGVGLIRSFDAHPNCLHLDVTGTNPEDAASRILVKVFPEFASERHKQISN